MHRFFAILLVAGPASAMQVDVPRPELCFTSTRVVLADVTSTETTWSTDADGGLETTVWFAAQKEFRGTGGDTIELLLPGGVKDGVEHWVEHSPRFIEDARYLLFLAPHAERGLQLLGGEQGAILISDKPGAPGEALSAAIRSLGDCYAP